MFCCKEVIRLDSLQVVHLEKVDTPHHERSNSCTETWSQSNVFAADSQQIVARMTVKHWGGTYKNWSVCL